MTFTFTAMGFLIAYLWSCVAIAFVLSIARAADRKPGWALFYFCEGCALLFLLVVR